MSRMPLARAPILRASLALSVMPFLRPEAASGGATHRLDVVAIGIEHEGTVIMRMIVWAKSGLAVVACAGAKGGRMEGIDLRARARFESDMKPPAERAARADPELRPRLAPEPRMRVPARLLRRYLDDQLEAERLERLFVEGKRAFEIADGKADVIEHGTFQRPRTYKGA